MQPVVVEAVGDVVEALHVQPVGVEALRVQALRVEPVVEPHCVQSVLPAVLQHVELVSPLLLRCQSCFLPPPTRNVDVLLSM